MHKKAHVNYRGAWRVHASAKAPAPSCHVKESLKNIHLFIWMCTCILSSTIGHAPPSPPPPCKNVHGNWFIRFWVILLTGPYTNSRWLVCMYVVQMQQVVALIGFRYCSKKPINMLSYINIDAQDKQYGNGFIQALWHNAAHSQWSVQQCMNCLLVKGEMWFYKISFADCLYCRSGAQRYLFFIPIFFISPQSQTPASAKTKKILYYQEDSEVCISLVTIWLDNIHRLVREPMNTSRQPQVSHCSMCVCVCVCWAEGNPWSCVFLLLACVCVTSSSVSLPLLQRWAHTVFSLRSVPLLLTYITALIQVTIQQRWR